MLPCQHNTYLSLNIVKKKKKKKKKLVALIESYVRSIVN